MYDVIIIGAGVVGCSVAREISKYKANVLVLERGNDVAFGATKANSGIVHAGFDAKPGTKKAYFNVKGAMMYPKLHKELDFPYRKNGALVLSFDDNGKETIDELLQRAKQNKVKGCELIYKEKIKFLICLC